MRFLLIVLFLCGCSTFHISKNIYTVESEFKPHIASYLDHKVSYLGTKKVNYPIYIKFGNLTDKKAGICKSETVTNQLTNESYTRKTIIIHQQYWDIIPYNCRELLIYHELGHCDLDLDHSDNIMSPQMQCQQYETKRNDWIEELFLGDI